MKCKKLINNSKIAGKCAVSKVKKGLKWTVTDGKWRLKAPLKIFTGSWFPHLSSLYLK